MDRDHNIKAISDSTKIWDMAVIGGGATGLGTALDAATRGLSVLLLEQDDFTKGTSSRSTKLVHGGVRYLAQGNIKLVMEALHERGLLLKNAPHLTSVQSFIIPNYSFWKGLYYFIGLKIYEILSGKLSLGKSSWLSSTDVQKHLPNISKDGLRNGIIYFDGQFDDARLGLAIAQTASDHGATVINHMKVHDLIKNKEGKVCGLKATDRISGNSFTINARTIINATGVFVDGITAMDQEHRPMVKPSQGTHIVLDRKFLPTDHALMIPETDDGRVLFAVPWHGKLIVGTTDTPIDDINLEPLPQQKEVEFILRNISTYLQEKPHPNDILTIFTGLRPLLKPKEQGKRSKDVSRDHKIFVSQSGLITITGGKWTTYRKMAEDVVNTAIKHVGTEMVPCKTKDIRIHGFSEIPVVPDHFAIYGSDALLIRKMIEQNPELGEKLHPRYPYIKAQVVWAVRNEMAMTIEDVLSRRIRLLLQDSNAAYEAAPVTAALMAKELQKDATWIDDQLAEFKKLAILYSSV